MKRTAAACALGLLASALLLACAGGAWTRAEPEPDPAATLLRSLVSDPPSPLPAPEGVVATDGVFRQIPLQWEPVLLPQVAGYLVESAEAVDGPWRPRVALLHRGALAWVDRDEPLAPLVDGETRFYRVRAFDHQRRLSESVSTAAVATAAPPMPPPAELRAYSRQPRSIPLVWSPAADPQVTGYVVERSPSADGPFDVVAVLDGRFHTHYLDTGLGDLAVLFYRVSSTDPAGGRGFPSGVLRALTKPAPLPPVGLRVESQRLSANTLRWEPNVESDLHSYRLMRWRDGAYEEVARVDASETRAEDGAVGASEVARYAVIAVDEDGLESRPSGPVAVEGLGYEWIARASSGGVRLVWNHRESEGFRGARVTRNGWIGSWTREVAPGVDLVDSDVVPGQLYRYRIELLRPEGPPAPSSEPIEIEIPEPGAPFVEIRAPASRLGPPEGLPR